MTRSNFTVVIVSFVASTFPQLAFGQSPIPKVIATALPEVLKAKPLEIGPADDELTRLLKARYNAAQTVAIIEFVDYWRGFQCNLVLDSGRRLLRAGLELNPSPKERLQFVGQMIEFANQVEFAMRLPPKEGLIPVESKKLEEFRLELAVERAKLEKQVKDAK